ncbi:hypothetical protein BDQ17DRAFT_1409529 [Cyathus striatus]|nr:hypothetical protein BDQ17DRAFT_1409529 [Cyathus striatus]
MFKPFHTNVPTASSDLHIMTPTLKDVEQESLVGPLADSDKLQPITLVAPDPQPPVEDDPDRKFLEDGSEEDPEEVDYDEDIEGYDGRGTGSKPTVGVKTQGPSGTKGGTVKK